MAKISPTSIKYMIEASFVAEGSLEKQDVIGAIFGQTEGLLGNDLDLRDLQKEGKIGRIEVNLEKDKKRTNGKIHVPTALDQSETTLIAAALETIEKVGPCDTQVDVEKIDDVRGNKRDYIVDRAKKLMQKMQSTDSREISESIKDSSRMSAIKEYGKNKIPCGDISGKELIVVEGRADVVNLLKHNIKNVAGMNGTRLPEEIKELGKKKEIILFVDGDRGGNLIAKNVTENVDVKSITSAPEGKEVEELTGKEIQMALRRTVSPQEFLSRTKMKGSNRNRNYKSGGEKSNQQSKAEKIEISGRDKEKLKEISTKNKGSKKAVLLNSSLEEMKKVSTKGLKKTLERGNNKPSAIVIDGTATRNAINTAESVGCSVIVANNFATTETSLELLSY